MNSMLLKLASRGRIMSVFPFRPMGSQGASTRSEFQEEPASTDRMKIKHSIYNDEQPGYTKRFMYNLIRMSRNYERNSLGLSIYQKKVMNELQKESPELLVDDVKELIYLSKTDEDIDILAKAIRTQLLSVNMERFDYSRAFMDLLYLLGKTDKAMEFLNNKEYDILFRRHRAVESLLEALLGEKRYYDVLNVLSKRIQRYFKYDKQVSPSGEQQLNPRSKGAPMTRRCMIPGSHFEMYTRAFLLLNTPEALGKFKQVVDFVLKNDGEVNKFYVLRLFYLALTQKDDEFCSEILRSGVFNEDKLLVLNLRTIVYSRLNRETEAFRQIKYMFRNNIKILPDTFRVLREDAKARQSIDNMNLADTFYKRAVLDDLLYTRTLGEIVLDYPQNIQDILSLEQSPSNSNRNQPNDDTHDNTNANNTSTANRRYNEEREYEYARN